MANIDAKNENGIINKVKGRVENFVRGIINSAVIDDTHEYLFLADVQNAFTQKSAYTKLYEKLSYEHDFDVYLDDLNTFGILNKNLPFYDKYLQSNSFDIIRKSISNKVVELSAKLNNQAITNTQSFKDIFQMSMVYNNFLINVIEIGNNKYKYQLIEPFRYKILDKTDEGLVTSAVIFTRTEDHKSGTMSYPSYFLTTKMNYEGKFISQTEHYYMLSNGKSVLISNVEDTNDNGASLFEYTGECIIGGIKNELFMSDVTETELATEIKSSTHSLHIDKKYMENNRIIRSGVYNIYDSEGLDAEMAPLFKHITPEIREESYINIKEHYLNMMAVDLGVNISALGFNTSGQQGRTATSSVIEETRTVDTINAFRSVFEYQMNKMFDLLQTGLVLELGTYQSQNLQSKAQIITQLNTNMSTESKIKFINPTMTEEQLLREIILVKTENNIPLTTEESDLALKMGILDEQIEPVVLEDTEIDGMNADG